MAREIKGNVLFKGKFNTSAGGAGGGKSVGYGKGTRLQQTPHHDDELPGKPHKKGGGCC